MTIFELIRFAHGKDATLGCLRLTGELLCFTLEDERRAVKVAGETRIPAGEYRLRLRDWGGFHERYSKQWPDMHKGMIELADVPGFTNVLLHLGNTDDDTAGCLLVGLSATCSWTIGQSKVAYQHVYPVVAGEIDVRGASLRIVEV